MTQHIGGGGLCHTLASVNTWSLYKTAKTSVSLRKKTKNSTLVAQIFHFSDVYVSCILCFTFVVTGHFEIGATREIKQRITDVDLLNIVSVFHSILYDNIDHKVWNMAIFRNSRTMVGSVVFNSTMNYTSAVQ